MNLFVSCILLIFFTSCASMPSLFQTVDDIATDDCITIKVDSDAFKRETDVKISLEVITKD